MILYAKIGAPNLYEARRETYEHMEPRTLLPGARKTKMAGDKQQMCGYSEDDIDLQREREHDSPFPETMKDAASPTQPGAETHGVLQLPATVHHEGWAAAAKLNAVEKTAAEWNTGTRGVEDAAAHVLTVEKT